MQQRDTEWFALRAGKFTGSRFKDLMARTKTGPSTSRNNLIATLAVERITGTCMETYQNFAMLRGIELEPVARAAYEDHFMLSVEEVAFIQHPRYDFVGCSPDGLVGDDGMLEIKCPNASDKHLQAILNNAHATEYTWQLQGNMWVAERGWIDAFSYDPRYPKGARCATWRVYSDINMFRELEGECIKADKEVNAVVEQLEEKMRAA